MHKRLGPILFVGLLANALFIKSVFAQSGKPAIETSSLNRQTAKKSTYTPLPSEDADGHVTQSPPIYVDAISDELRKEYRINPFYKKSATIVGIPIIGSEKVSDYAFLECAWTLDHLLHGRTLAHDALLACKVRVGIIAVTEYTLDIPENQRPQMIARGAYHDRRSRGLGGLPLATCAEENLLNLRGDPYIKENITIHEFSHTVASAIRRVNRAWYNRLRDAYNDAQAKGIYGDSYAGTNEQEYWAEGAQCWFDCANPKNAGGASNREQLKAKDAALATLLTEVYGDDDWRYTKIMNRPAAVLADVAHLAGLNRLSFPVFDFDNSPRIQAAAKQAEQGSQNGDTDASSGAGKSDDKPMTPARSSANSGDERPSGK
ncbi:MAG TPA: hypothetical protein VFE46_12175 [Pirellulales bacterium]|jgi:alpha-glucosidase|nr:hypothetical protein [Pirellulales bacterium]